MALRIATILLICSAGFVFAQYADESGNIGSSKKLLISGGRRIKSQVPRLVGSIPQTNQKFRRPIHKPRVVDPVVDLPIFTSGIRSSRPSSISSTASFEQNDEVSALPIQAIQQPQIQHSEHHEVKPVNEEHEKDQDIVQVIANLETVSGNLITPTVPSSVSTAGSISYVHQQQQPLPIQYRPIQQVSRSSLNIEPETQTIHQVIAPVQYRPQKPIKLYKHQQHPSIVERNEYDINEARPIKQRTQVTPKKTKSQSDYYEGRTKKPVAQVIRRYREETADGSIIWGFENDDGSFKEEIIGIDCITRGKYGYVDPDGVRREYTYETGIKCDEEAQQQQDQDILNTFVDYQENKLVLPSGKTIDLSSMGKKQARRPQLYRN